MNASYTVAFSAGVASGGSGNFSSRACVITSESGIHFSSIFIKGTLPSGLMLKNLHIKHITKGPFKLRAQMYSKYFRKPRQTELSGNTASKVRSLPLGFVAQIHQLQFIRKVFLLQCKQNPLREGTCKHLLYHSWKIHTNTVWIISRSTPGNFNFKINENGKSIFRHFLFNSKDPLNRVGNFFYKVIRLTVSKLVRSGDRLFGADLKRVGSFRAHCQVSGSSTTSRRGYPICEKPPRRELFNGGGECGSRRCDLRRRHFWTRFFFFIFLRN